MLLQLCCTIWFWKAGSVLCFIGVFSCSRNSEEQFLIKAHWHIDPQTASGGQSPSQPLQMLSQEISPTTPQPPCPPPPPWSGDWRVHWGGLFFSVSCCGLLPITACLHSREILWRNENCSLSCWARKNKGGTIWQAGGKTAVGTMVTSLVDDHEADMAPVPLRLPFSSSFQQEVCDDQ